MRLESVTSNLLERRSNPDLGVVLAYLCSCRATSMVVCFIFGLVLCFRLDICCILRIKFDVQASSDNPEGKIFV